MVTTGQQGGKLPMTGTQEGLSEDSGSQASGDSLCLGVLATSQALFLYCYYINDSNCSRIAQFTTSTAAKEVVKDGAL